MQIYVNAQAQVPTGRGWWFPLLFQVPAGRGCLYLRRGRSGAPTSTRWLDGASSIPSSSAGDRIMAKWRK
jgi:hypothetical protein